MVWTRCVRWLLLGLVGLALLACQGPLPSTHGVYQFQPPSRDGIGKVYMGREIAQVMGHEGAYWLERPSRQLQEHPDQMLEVLELQPDDIVADIGAGTGYMAIRVAQQVPDGQVLAVDIQPEMLDLLNQRIADRGLTQITPVQGTLKDPHLPVDSIDVALLVDAYHEFEYPFEMMTHLWTALKPGGRVVLAEYRAENPLVLIKRLHKMSEAQVKREMRAAGFTWLTTNESLPQQHLLFFEKPV